MTKKKLWDLCKNKNIYFTWNCDLCKCDLTNKDTMRLFRNGDTDNYLYLICKDCFLKGEYED